jgi:hypothetical protein
MRASVDIDQSRMETRSMQINVSKLAAQIYGIQAPDKATIAGSARDAYR